MDTWFKEFFFSIYQIKKLGEINLNVKNWKIQINCDDCNNGGDFSQEYVIIMH